MRLRRVRRNPILTLASLETLPFLRDWDADGDAFSFRPFLSFLITSYSLKNRMQWVLHSPSLNNNEWGFYMIFFPINWEEHGCEASPSENKTQSLPLQARKEIDFKWFWGFAEWEEHRCNKLTSHLGFRLGLLRTTTQVLVGICFISPITSRPSLKGIALTLRMTYSPACLLTAET